MVFDQRPRQGAQELPRTYQKIMRGINKVGQDMVVLVLRVLVLLVLLVLVTLVIPPAGCISSKVQRICGGLAEEVLWRILFSTVLKRLISSGSQNLSNMYNIHIFFEKQLLHSYLLFVDAALHRWATTELFVAGLNQGFVQVGAVWTVAAEERWDQKSQNAARQQNR